jgi:hypothetical protein
LNKLKNLWKDVREDSSISKRSKQSSKLRRLITEKEITKEITEQRAANVDKFTGAKGKRDKELRDDQKRQGVLEKTAKTSQSAALLAQGLSSNQSQA